MRGRVSGFGGHRGFGRDHAAVGEVYGAVGEGGQVFVVCDDDEGLLHFVAQAEEEAVQLVLVVAVEAA